MTIVDQIQQPAPERLEGSRGSGLPFVRDLARHGEAPALRAEGEIITYAVLAQRVGAAARAWSAVGAGPRLVQMELVPTPEAVVSYLGALAAGHVVLVTAAEGAGRIRDTYPPDSVAALAQGRWTIRHLRDDSALDLHPELTLLLSTSGSTGSPKLVRLSAANLAANTASIIDGLGITAADVAVTTLPLHYCFGLSILHTHLAAGASVLLTERSVTDPRLWQEMARAGVTSMSGVPHTFELLASARRSPGDVTSVRQVTQAGGRLAPELVRDLATRGTREGWELRVMYGQTEATARMSIATAREVIEHPERVGRAVAGGRFEVRGGNELIYHGENVMLGYAHGPGDLALGRTTDELATGDLARIHPDGTLEITGRASSFLKILGQRIDVLAVEDALRGEGIEALVTGDDETLVVLTTHQAHRPARGRRRTPRGAAIAQRASGLPPHRVRVVDLPQLPRTSSGKPDRYAARTAYVLAPSAPTLEAASSGDLLADLIEVYEICLGREGVTPEATFVGLRGDSLSYVEVAVQLEDRLGTLPADWPQRPLRELAADATSAASATGAASATSAAGAVGARRSRPIAHLDATVVIRAVAITMIVLGHTRVAMLLGGAHILLAVAGFNFGRFAGQAASARARVRATGGTLLKILIPTAIWVSIVGLIAGSYSLANVFLVNWIFGPEHWSSHWRLWFIEALAWILIAVVGVLAIPPVQRWYAARPFALAAGIATIALLARLDVFDLTSPPGRGTAPAVLWLFAIGWAAAHVRRLAHRAYLALLLLIGLPGFMDNPIREATIAAGIGLLLWCPTLPVPRLLVPVLGVLASSSLYIYLTHFQVYQATAYPIVNLALSLGLGVATWVVVTRVGATARRRGRSSRPLPIQSSTT